MIKIALAGKAGSGKNLFFDIARKEFPGLHFSEAKLAEPIYGCMREVQKVLDIPNHKDGRLLQLIGNHYRENNEHYWVDKFFRNNYRGNHIVTDIRFPNELRALDLNDYITVRINRKLELRDNNLGNRDSNHSSETALDGISDTMFDYTINNNGSLELFEGAVITIINRIRESQ